MSLGNWRFDPVYWLLVVIAIPLAYYLGTIVLSYLKAWGHDLLDAVMYRVGRFVFRTMPASTSLKEFCRRLLDGQSRFLHVPATTDIRMDIDTMYVPLQLDSSGDSPASLTHSDILGSGSRILVIGEPGSGKSSLMKRLLRDECRRALSAPRRARFPIMIELKSISVPSDPVDRPGEWLLDHISDEVSRSRVFQIDKTFNSYLETTGLLILLDGLDEVALASYPIIQEAINDLCRILERIGPKNAVVVTMRNQFYNRVRDDFREAFSHVMFLNRFTPSEVFDFLSRWPSLGQQPGKLLQIYGELADRPTLREMCSNPLVLAMYVAERQATAEFFAPESRTDFYRKVADELLIRRRNKQLGTNPATTRTRNQRERVLGSLAYRHITDAEQPLNSLSWSDAVDTVVAVYQCSPADAEQLLQEIAKETGLILEERIGDTFQFIHLTFCEFFAAAEAAQGIESGWIDLFRVHHEFTSSGSPPLASRLIEVIPFTIGLLPRYHRAKAISDVREMNDLRLLPSSLLETKTYEHPAWPAFAQAEMESLITTPEEYWDSQWLQRLYLLTVVVRDAALSLPQHDEVPIRFESFLQVLISKQSSSLNKLFSAYATQDAAAAFRIAEACRINLAELLPHIVITNCDQRPFLALVQDRAVYGSPAWAALLSEAALRSKATANLIESSPISADLEDLLSTPEGNDHWWELYLAPRDRLSSLITLALNGNKSLPRECEMLQLLQQVHPPSSRRFAVYLLWMALAGACATLFLLLISRAPFSGLIDRAPVQPTPRIIALREVPVVSFLFMYLIFQYLGLVTEQYRQIYHYILHKASTNREFLPALPPVPAAIQAVILGLGLPLRILSRSSAGRDPFPTALLLTERERSAIQKIAAVRGESALHQP
jgi:hypothetical protein